MKLIVGLGNPGCEYERTRHNVGYMALESIAHYYKIVFNKNKFGGKYGELLLNGEKVILLKPEKFMNLSGEVVRDYINFFKIDIQDILIIHDDLDTSIGSIRLRYKGSSGGHNGLKNIELHLGTKEYRRIKIGISNNKLMDTKDYVLGKFSKEEMEILNPIIEKMPEIFESFLNKPFDNLMNKYNK